MNFVYTDEEEVFRQEVADFCKQRLHLITREGAGNPRHADTPERKQFVKDMAKKGWLSMSYPAEYGGQGKSGMTQFVLNEELSHQGAPIIGTSVGTIGMTILHHGSDRLKQEFLPGILAGEIDFALGYSEPEAGSDLASLQLRATRDGDEYVINGQKRFTSGAHYADYVWLAARTNPEVPKHRGISLFVVDIKSPGITIRPLWTMGDERTNEVYYDNVRIPAHYRVGEENRGWYYLAEALDYERFAIYPYGTVRLMFDRYLAWFQTAEIDGKPVRDNPGYRHKVARLAIELEIGWMHMVRAAAVALNGVPNVEATMNKLFATQLQQRIANTAVDSMGLYGQLAQGSKHAQIHGRFERHYRREVIAPIAGGTSEVQKNIIAKRLLNLPG